MSGNYSMYGVEILLQRSITPYLLSYFLPSTLLAIISWLSFLVPQVLLRLCLQLLIIIILLNMVSITRSSAPPSNNINALDIWLLGCLLLMIISILELILRSSKLWTRGGTGNRSQSSVTCCHHQSAATCPSSRCHSTSSSRANIISSTEEFVQVRNQNSMNSFQNSFLPPVPH